MTYEQATEYIHGIYWRGSKLGLERITELLCLMGNPQDKLSFVHVAGTNGKGSVCAMLSCILAAEGYKTGLYISPYIERFNERIQINNLPIADKSLCEVTEYVRAFAETMADLPTEFEIVCAIAFEYFMREGCEIVVLEVGLGGRMDATNVIKSPLAAVITPISYDHTEYLGETLAEIASEKCGIIKKGTAVVCCEQTPEAAEVVAQRCRDIGAGLVCAEPSHLETISDTIDGQRFNYKEFSDIEIALPGEHQRENAALVLETVSVLRERGTEISHGAVKSGMAEAKWPARFEVLSRRPIVVLDGAHNPGGARAAALAAARYLGGMDITVVLGVLRDKDYGAMLEEIDKVAARYIATEPDNPRALKTSALAVELGRLGKPVSEQADIALAVARAVETAKRECGAVLVVGSLYMAGEVRKCFAPEHK